MNLPVVKERAERTAEGDFLLQIDLTSAVQLLVLHEVRVEWLTGRTVGNNVRWALHLPSERLYQRTESGRPLNEK